MPARPEHQNQRQHAENHDIPPLEADQHARISFDARQDESPSMAPGTEPMPPSKAAISALMADDETHVEIDGVVLQRFEQRRPHRSAPR